MRKIVFQSVPFDKVHVTLALESGVDTLIVPADFVEEVQSLARCTVLAHEETAQVALLAKSDEDVVAQAAATLDPSDANAFVTLVHGWEIIPVENLLACSDAVAKKLAVQVASLDEARLAAGILERGVDTLVVLPAAIEDVKTIMAELTLSQGHLELLPATITAVKAAGLGHRVCVDTMTRMKRGQGMLVGNSSAFTFLAHAETEHNNYVASRPFRINAGAVHAYAVMPQDKTTYLDELASGTEVLIVDAKGETTIATVGRLKVEVRPMLLVEAVIKGDDGVETKGAVFLQNAETICLTRPDGTPVSVVTLREGDKVLCRSDVAGRHFGMRITEDISES